MKKVVVNRRRWRRGGVNQFGRVGSTRLLNEEGFKCCLGFACNQLLGLKDEDILGRSSPSYLKFDVVDADNILLYSVKDGPKNGTNKHVPSAFSERAMCINDDNSIRDEQREQELIELGKQHGVEFEFIN